LAHRLLVSGSCGRAAVSRGGRPAAGGGHGIEWE
jgi:hypothetical protein